MYRSNPTYRQIRLSVILEYHADQFRYKQIQKTTVTKFIIYNFRKNFPWPWKLSISSKQYNPKTEISLITPSVNTVKYIHPKLPLPEKKIKIQKVPTGTSSSSSPLETGMSRATGIYTLGRVPRGDLSVSLPLLAPRKKSRRHCGAPRLRSHGTARAESQDTKRRAAPHSYISIYTYIYILSLSLAREYDIHSRALCSCRRAQMEREPVEYSIGPRRESPAVRRRRTRRAARSPRLHLWRWRSSGSFVCDT